MLTPIQQAAKPKHARKTQGYPEFSRLKSENKCPKNLALNSYGDTMQSAVIMRQGPRKNVIARLPTQQWHDK